MRRAALIKSSELTIRTSSTGLKSIEVSHDPGEQKSGLDVLRAVLPALYALDHSLKRAHDKPEPMRWEQKP